MKGASLDKPWTVLHRPLVKPYVRFSLIRLTDSRRERSNTSRMRSAHQTRTFRPEQRKSPCSHHHSSGGLRKARRGAPIAVGLGRDAGANGQHAAEGAETEEASSADLMNVVESLDAGSVLKVSEKRRLHDWLTGRQGLSLTREADRYASWAPVVGRYSLRIESR